MSRRPQKEGVVAPHLTTPSLDPGRLAAEIDQRVQAAVEAHTRRRRRAAELGAELARCRAVGKATRHRRRLAQIEARLREATVNGTDDSWWEEPG